MVMILLYNSQCAVLKYRFWCSFVFFLDCRLNFDVMKLKHSKKHYENILLLNTELSYIGIIYFIFFISLGHLYFTVPIFLFTFRCLWWCNLPSFCLGEQNINKRANPTWIQWNIWGLLGRVLPKSLNLKATSSHKVKSPVLHITKGGSLLMRDSAGWLMALTAIFQRKKKYIKVSFWLLGSNGVWTQFDMTLKCYWTIYQNHHHLLLELHKARGSEPIRGFHHKNKCHC